MKKFWRRLGVSWRQILIGLLCLLALVGLYTYHLGTLAPQLSPAELQSATSSNHYQKLATNGIDLPHRSLQWLSLKLTHIPYAWQVRLPSVVLAILSVGLMAYILRRWYGRRSMAFGLLLFAPSVWLLHVGRFGSSDIEYVVLPLALIASTIFIQDHEDKPWAGWTWLLVNSAALFVPGAIYFVLLNVVWAWRPIIRSWSETPLWQKLASLVVPLAVLGDLALTFVLHRSLIITWLGLSEWPTMSYIKSLPEQLLTAASAGFWRMPTNPELWLGHLPLLDGFIIVMFAAGVVFYATHWRAARARILGAFVMLSILVAGLGVVSLGTVVPIIYLIAVAGIAYVLHAWLRVFPRNPLARGFGFGLVLILIGLAGYYNSTQYFVAWPHNPSVEKVYQVKR